MAQEFKIMLSGGGSGGPVTPLLAVAKEIYRRHAEAKFVFIGSNKGPEKKLVLEAASDLPIIFKPILSGKLRRYFSWKNLTDLFNIIGAFFQSLYILKEEKPALVMSAGAFVSVPLAWAAKSLGIPVLIHQQDVVSGLANRLMAGAAKMVSVTFEKSLKAYGSKAVLTGNPFEFSVLASRAEVFKEFDLDITRPLALIFGGGTGAKAINEAVVNNLDKLLEISQVIHISGEGKNISYDRAGYRAVEFLPHKKILSIMAAADLIVARCGLATITELSALQKPSILIPMPGTHQEANADICREREAAIILKQAELDANLVPEIKALLDSDIRRHELAEKMGRINKPGAAREIADLALSLIK